MPDLITLVSENSYDEKYMNINRFDPKNKSTTLEHYQSVLKEKKTKNTFRKGGCRYIPCTVHKKILKQCYIVDCTDRYDVDVTLNFLERTPTGLAAADDSTPSTIHVRNAREHKKLMTLLDYFGKIADKKVVTGSC